MIFVIEFLQFICVQLLDMYCLTEVAWGKKKNHTNQPKPSDFYKLLIQIIYLKMK